MTAADPLALESLLAFWAEAGVDACLEDAPVDRLAPRARIAPPPPAPPSPAPGLRTAASLPPAADVGEAQAVAASAGDLAALEAAFAAFDLGGLRPAGARNLLWRRGADLASVVVVGGPPGPAEEAAGEAFAGPAGRLLDRMLAAAGVDGSALRLHAAPWRPPGDRDPTLAEAAPLRAFLLRAITLAQPKAILVLGDQAARVLLDRAEGVLKLRGRPVDNLSHFGPSEAPPVFVTFGPAFLLRQPRLKAQAWADLLSLASAVDAGRNGS